ncbi:MAG TPA: hypothetical protein VHW64_01825 [Nocardioides sp.]|uniref:hypothetical protein n=1 Tax=Nocardioides sp. TaxID=35761 RepID=UPI002E3199AC|nr:hypothetical protein [Nocardioides sp.]HEX3929413.1 hypothetical protein [Nocardioides sp.]
MIRLGSLAGYPFEGPRLLAGFTAPALPAVYAILYVPDPAKQEYAVTYVDHTADLSTEGLPFRHPRSPCWVERAGSKWKVHVATYEVPGGLASHRELIVQELCAVYQPSCNGQQFDQAWQDHWIAGYEAPTWGALGTGRQPGQSRLDRDPAANAQDGTGA